VWEAIPILKRLRTTTRNPLYYLPIRQSRISLAILPNGMRLLCPYEDMFVISEIFIDQIYNRIFKLKDRFIAIDVGAHVGVFTLKASKEVGEKGLVISFEPNPSTFNLLKRNLKMNRITNVIPYQIALSNSSSKGKLYQSPHPREDSLVKARSKYALVNIDILDKVISELNLERIDFIKIDVEESELRVLEGAQKTLAKFRPNLAIAAYHELNRIEEISEFLLRNNFRVFINKPYVYAK
jgi:FkbM family methyltransferase